MRACFRLLPGAAQVDVRETRIRDLDGFFAAFEAARATSTFSVGWIDALASGKSLGRGVFETAEFAPGTQAAPPARKPLPVPFDLPGFALSSASVRVFNEFYWRRVPAAGRQEARDLQRFLFPLDSLTGWNRLYGKRGFYQFQSVVPDAQAHAATRAMLEAISGGGNASFLAVLKTLGGTGRGHLSFPMRGVTLALDIPRASGADELMRGLERIARDAGGRIYLAKDATMSTETFAETYPALPKFEAALREFDPEGRFASDQSRRLGIGRRPRMNPVWLVLGATSAIAREFARLVAERGSDVLLAARDIDDARATAADISIRTGRRCEAFQFDATDAGSQEALVVRAQDFAGGTALSLFLAFGTMPDQASIDADPALIAPTIATNFTAAVEILQRFAPVLEAQGSGSVVAIGSVAGDRGRLKNYVLRLRQGRAACLSARPARASVPLGPCMSSR